MRKALVAMARVMAVTLSTTVALACSTAPQVSAAASSDPAVGVQAPSQLPEGEGPCRYLSIADVRAAFAGARAGTLDRRQQPHGLLTCVWEYPTGRLSVIEGTGPPQPAMDEARGWTLVFLDPLDGGAERRVRYEHLSGVGDEAVAIVERADKARGFINDGAILVVTRRSRQVTLMSTDLARRERAEALKTLEALGKAMARRLE